jgi:hypothetical protein
MAAGRLRAAGIWTCLLQEYPMLLHRMSVGVENTLRGHLSGRAIAVYYFHLAGGINGPRPLGSGTTNAEFSG